MKQPLKHHKYQINAKIMRNLININDQYHAAESIHETLNIKFNKELFKFIEDKKHGFI